MIAIDCDDVLVQTAGLVINNYNAKYGTNLILAEFYGRDMDRWHAASQKVASQRVRDILLESDDNLQVPGSDAIETVLSLAKTHELHLVTGRDDVFKPMTQLLADKYFPGCFKSIEHTNYFVEGKKRSKGEVCKMLGADLLVDDHVEHVRSVLDAGLREVIVFGDYPWNRNEALPDGAMRCNSWREVLEEVNRIAR